MMLAAGLIFAAVVTAFVAWKLIQGHHPQLILLAAGLVFLIASWALGNPLEATDSTGWRGFDLFDLIVQSMRSKLGGIGTMIMVIAGFVAYMDYMGATKAMVQAAMRPIDFLRGIPHLAAIMVLPLGQLLSLCVPSAAGLGLLMIASVHPILLRIGISPLASVSIITLCTCFDMGPASANTARAADLLGMGNVTYFLGHQAPLAGSITLVVMAVVFFQLRRLEPAQSKAVPKVDEPEKRPFYFAFLPVLPLILLMTFSSFFQTGPSAVILDTSTAMLISLALSMLLHRVSGAKAKEIEGGLKECWKGMGRAFSQVVTLIIAADLFAKGLIELGLIEGLLVLVDGLGWGALGILVIFVALIFFASILMGSGNASFFAFGPLVSKVAESMSIPGIRLLLPMQLASSMGRAASPISGVVIATSGIAGVNPLDVARRNALPMAIALILMVLTESYSLI
jgi:DcuC family C4-dicarboxylate transporter